jgi:hypothetical protein
MEVLMHTISQAEKNKIEHALQGSKTENPPYLGIPGDDPDLRDKIGKILCARGGDALKPLWVIGRGR